jgi:lysophospholipase
MELETSHVDGFGNAKIFVRDFRPEAGDSPPTIFFVHGLGEHGGRYGHLFEWLVTRGWRVIAPDLRGHGMSSGPRTHVRSFEEYIRDLAILWDQFQLGSGQTVVAAHSMGGLVSIRAVETGAIDPSALVLSSPLLGLLVKVNPIKWLLGQALVNFFPETRFKNGIDPSNMTHDPNFAEERLKDPLIIRTVTAGWFFAMQRALTLAHRDVAKIRIPIFAIRGLADETTDGDELSHWLAKTNAPIRELVSLPAHVHEIFHESDWRKTADRMVDWLDRLGVIDNK